MYKKILDPQSQFQMCYEISLESCKRSFCDVRPRIGGASVRSFALYRCHRLPPNSWSVSALFVACCMRNFREWEWALVASIRSRQRQIVQVNGARPALVRHSCLARTPLFVRPFLPPHPFRCTEIVFINSSGGDANHHDPGRRLCIGNESDYEWDAKADRTL